MKRARLTRRADDHKETKYRPTIGSHCARRSFMSSQSGGHEHNADNMNNKPDVARSILPQGNRMNVKDMR
ncbi:hypothetical protein AGMMS50289_21700 [Betaproteobacteria bacterium]|nr:hypothetical protein AGMMS50289_21700 [Betaproteobacteria bacterium]